VYDVFQDPDGTATRFLMKLVAGPSLAALLEQAETPLVEGVQLERLLTVVLKVCDAVSFAHDRGIVHRDLTPGNVMVGPYGQVYVMDWGLALLRDRSRPPAEGALSGTLAYMAPEQARGEVDRIGPATDVFGLGGLLYHILTLRPPWRGAVPLDAWAQARRGVVPEPTAVVGDRPLPARLCRIAMRALAAEPGDRHASVEDLRDELQDFLRGGGWFEQAHFARGTAIVREGERGTTAYIVTAGTCEVYRTGAGGRHVLRTVGPGQVFGEVGLITEEPRTATVEAKTDVTALVVTRDTLEREVAQRSWMRAFVQAAVERFVELDRPVPDPGDRPVAPREPGSG
jgi:serine/threonine-protein kinase